MLCTAMPGGNLGMTTVYISARLNIQLDGKSGVRGMSAPVNARVKDGTLFHNKLTA